MTKTIKPWTIYIWRNKKKMEGASPIVTKDGIKRLYFAGWKIEKDPEAQKNEERHKVWRARINVKNLLNNTMNVINWYGKKVLDKNGDVSTDKFDKLELKTAKEAVKVNNITKYGNGILNKKGEISPRKLQKAEKKLGKLEGGIGMEDIHKIKFYPVKDITLEEARKYKFTI